jgi:excisionase family DNA binding protein
VTKETFTLTEAAEYLNTSTETLEELIDTGAMPAGRIGKAYVLHIADLREYLRAEIERQTAERRDYARRIAAGQMARSERPAIKTASGAARTKYGRRNKLPALPALDA